MKKRLHLYRHYVVALLFCFSYSKTIYAQYIGESFETTLFPPQGWVLDNPAAGNPFNIKSWALNDDSNHVSDGEHSLVLHHKTLVYHSSWVITKGVVLQAGEEVKLSYDYKPYFTYATPDPISLPFQVSVGTSQTAAGQTTVLQTHTIDWPGGYSTEEISYTAPAAGTYYFAFSLSTTTQPQLIMQLQGGDFYLFLDKVIVQPNNCQALDGLNVDSTTSTSVELSWNAQTENSWEVQVFHPFFPGQLPKEEDWVPASTNPFTLGGLTPGVAYKAYVRASCSTGGLGLFSDPVSFTTPCSSSIVAPYFVPFLTNSIPGCWQESGDTAWNFNTNATAAAAAAGDHTFFQPYSTNYAWVSGFENTATNDEAILTSPLVDISALSSPAIEFYLFSENSNYNTYNDFEAEVFDGTNWQTAVSLNQSSNGWRFYSIDLSQYSITQTTKIRFIVTGAGNNHAYYNDILIDDIAFTEKTTCLPLSSNALETTFVTDTSATMHWGTSPGEVFDIAYGETDNYFFEGIANDVSVSAPHTIHNLNPETSYEVYIRKNCGGGDHSQWAGPLVFETACAAVDPIQYIELFDVNPNPSFLPECWQQAMGGTPQTGPLEIGSQNLDGWQYTDALYYDPWGSTVDDRISVSFINVESAWALSPFFDLSATNDYEALITVSIDPPYGNEPTFPIESMGDDDEIKFIYSIDGINWQTLKTWDAQDKLSPGKYTTIASLSSIVGAHVQFAFWSTTGQNVSNYRFSVYEFEIRQAETCKMPLNLHVDGITNTSAKLSWEEFGLSTSWEICVVPEGDSPTAWQTVSTNPYEKTGLTEDTTYDFYIRGICNGSTTAETAPKTFTTRCNPLVAPYTETFDENTLPDCWSLDPELPPFYNYGSDFDYWYSSLDVPLDGVGVNDHTAGGGTNYLWLNSEKLLDNGYTVLQTPLMDISSLNNPAFQFYLFSKNSYDGAVNHLQIDFYDGTSWHELTTIANVTNGWSAVTLDLSNYPTTEPVEIRFTIVGKANGGNPFFHTILIDDVGFIEMPDCPAPYNPQVINITTTSALVTWEYGGGTGFWELEYGVAGFSPGSGTIQIINNGDQELLLSNLDETTSYEVYLTTICQQGNSERIGPIPFETLMLGKEAIEGYELNIYPNPVQSELHIQSELSIEYVELYNVLGNRVLQKKIQSKDTTIDFSMYAAGIYLLRLSTEDQQQTKTYKIIKR